MKARTIGAVGALAAVLVLGVLAGGCKKHDADHDDMVGRATDPAPRTLPAMPEAEVQRAKDACAAYVTHVCECAKTVTAAAQPCELARALPDAIRISTEVAASPDSSHQDVLHAQDSLRKTVAECIGETAKLPTLGCP